MIDAKEVLAIHKLLVDRFGGTTGVRDLSALESALQRPFQTLDSEPVYSDVLEQAAALIESILVNHPFLDGNKRIGYVLIRRFLIQNNMDIHASEQEKYDFVIAIASGKYKFEDILSWLERSTIRVNDA